VSILKGAIDMHVHSAPDYIPRKLNDLELAIRARDYGLKALLIKSHHLPTMDRAYIVSRVVKGIKVFGGLVLNIPSCGGLNVEAVRVAVKLGAKEIWMPTISANNHVKYFKHGERGINIITSSGELVPVVEEILSIIAENSIILGTGHLSVQEIKILVDEAKSIGVRKILITHPEYEVVNMSIEDQKELARKGVYFERCFYSIATGKIKPEDIAQAIREVGVESTIIATDLGQVTNPDPVSGLSMYVKEILRCGFTEREIEIMIKENPAKLLEINNV